MSMTAESQNRRRVRIIIALVCVILLGLATRLPSLPWPSFVAINFGDALWTSAVYLSLCFIAKTCTPLSIALYAISISFCVELSQLIDWEMLNTARQTLPGRLLLGTGFQWLDFPRYAAGAILLMLIEVKFKPLEAVSKSLKS